MSIAVFYNPARKSSGEGASLSALGPEKAEEVRAFHKTFKEYAPTPLHDLTHLADAFGLGHILV